MIERADLLGGTCEAGPNPGRGWTVTAVLPRTGIGDVSIRVLVADDQEIVRTGLAMILDAQPDIEVIGEAADGRRAVELARRLRPDVCLFDIRMPGLDGIEATRAARRTGRRGPARRRRHHHVRPRRVRLRRAAGRRPGLPAQGRRHRPARPGRPRRRRRRRAHRPERHRPAARGVRRRRARPAAGAAHRAAHRPGGAGPRHGGPRADQQRDRRRALHHRSARSRPTSPA